MGSEMCIRDSIGVGGARIRRLERRAVRLDLIDRGHVRLGGAVGHQGDPVGTDVQIAGRRIGPGLLQRRVDAIGHVLIVGIMARGKDLRAVVAVLRPQGRTRVDAIRSRKTSTRPGHLIVLLIARASYPC